VSNGSWKNLPQKTVVSSYFCAYVWLPLGVRFVITYPKPV